MSPFSRPLPRAVLEKGGGVWVPKVCAPKMARPDFTIVNLAFSHKLTLWSLSSGGVRGVTPPPPAVYGHSNASLPLPPPSGPKRQSARKRLGEAWEGGLGVPPHTQNDSHDALIILRCVSGGKEFVGNLPPGRFADFRAIFKSTACLYGRPLKFAPLFKPPPPPSGGSPAHPFSTPPPPGLSLMQKPKQASFHYFAAQTCGAPPFRWVQTAQQRGYTAKQRARKTPPFYHRLPCDSCQHSRSVHSADQFDGPHDIFLAPQKKFRRLRRQNFPFTIRGKKESWNRHFIISGPSEPLVPPPRPPHSHTKNKPVTTTSIPAARCTHIHTPIHENTWHMERTPIQSRWIAHLSVSSTDLPLASATPDTLRRSWALLSHAVTAADS